MKFRVVRLFNGKLKPTDPIAYKVETEAVMTQGQAVKLMEILDKNVHEAWIEDIK